MFINMDFGIEFNREVILASYRISNMLEQRNFSIDIRRSIPNVYIIFGFEILIRNEIILLFDWKKTKYCDKMQIEDEEEYIWPQNHLLEKLKFLTHRR